MNTLRRHGFTLLELVISCAIVVTIFTLAATALTRVHRLRAESESQTRLMTEGRALLDDLANQLAYVAGTNIWISDDAGGKDGLSLAMIRYAVHPQSRKGGEASNETPYYSMRLDFTSSDLNNPTSSVERIARSSNADDEILYTNVNHVTFDTIRRDSSTVTNAYSADEMGTHIPSASAGDTISVPVTSGSSVTTYGSRTSFDASISAIPSPFTGTNTVLADVVFENDHSGENTVTIRKPVAGRWPQPSKRVVRIQTTADIRAENIATNAFMTPGYLDYTNVPLSIATFPADDTNATARTTLSAMVMAYDSLSPAYTNTNDVVSVSTNELGSVPYPDAPYASSTNGLVAGELLYGPYDSPFVVSNYWSWGDSGDVNTNGIVSGLAIVVNGRTNTYASAADVAASSTSTVTYADANFQFSEILDLLTVDLDNGEGLFGSLSNLVAAAIPVAFTNEFAPKDAAGAAVPLFVSEILAYEERVLPQNFAAAFSVQSASATTGTNATPLALQTYRRELGLVIEREVTTNDMVLRVVHDWRTHTDYKLLFDVDESLVPTNAQHYGGITTNIFPNGTSYDSETRWHDVVLDEDFDGADERTTGIWLREEKERRDNTELVVRTNSTSVGYAPPKDKQAGVSEKSIAPAIWDSIQKAVITPLCFSTNENQRLNLMVWDPEDDPPGPPVCADIYLELLAPIHQRRAKRIKDDERREHYIQNHVIRISRRAPIGTARKVLP